MHAGGDARPRRVAVRAASLLGRSLGACPPAAPTAELVAKEGGHFWLPSQVAAMARRDARSAAARRLLEAAVRGPGWGAPEDVLRLLPGPAFDVAQSAGEAGLPAERPAPPRPPPTGMPGRAGRPGLSMWRPV